MSDSEECQNTHDTDFFIFNTKNYESSRNFLVQTIKYAALYGADKALMNRKSSARSKGFNEISSYGVNQDDCKACERKTKAKYCVQKDDMAKIVKFPSRDCFTIIPQNLIMFSAVLVLKLISFQLSLFMSFFTAPVRLSYSIVMFPLQTLMGMKKQLSISFSRMWFQLISHSSSYLYARVLGKNSFMNIGFKLSRALFWCIGVCLLLVWLLFSGFLVGGIVMRRIVEHPIKTTQALNFDYTEESPVTFVPVNLYNHKFQLTVALTLPESEYNMELGMFQVRLDLLSANGSITAKSSHPCMLKYKSAQIRFIETVFKTIPLIAGYQTESQIMQIKVRDLALTRNEPIGYLKVAIEQRAEFKSGAGIPQIYDASLTVESEMSKIKQIVWAWRWTMFVGMSFVAFWTELIMVLIFFRFYIMPRGQVKVAMDSHRNKISWSKYI